MSKGILDPVRDRKGGERRGGLSFGPLAITGAALLVITIGASIFCATAASAQVAVRGQTVYTMSGAPIQDGVVLIGRDGKIERVGPASSVRVPNGYRTLEAAVVTPGLVDAHTVVGLAGYLNQAHDQDQLERSNAIQPELRAIDAYNAEEALIDWVRGFGVTTLHTGHGPGALMSGQTMIVKTRGRTVEEAMVEPVTMVAMTLGPGLVELLGRICGQPGRHRHRARSRCRRPVAAPVLLGLGVLGERADLRGWRSSPGRAFVPTSPMPARSRLDGPGALLSIVGLSALVYAIIEGPSLGWTSRHRRDGVHAGRGRARAFVVTELHSRHPMLDLRLFTNPRFTAASLAVTRCTSACSARSSSRPSICSSCSDTTHWARVSAASRSLVVLLVVANTTPRIVGRIGTQRGGHDRFVDRRRVDGSACWLHRRHDLHGRRAHAVPVRTRDGPHDRARDLFDHRRGPEPHVPVSGRPSTTRLARSVVRSE